jgi:hypothetical protein
MSYNSTIALDLISESQAGKATTANALFDAMSPAALFGIKSVSGLVVNFYGGNINVSGTPTAVATQQITLSNNATNYIYSTSAGVVTKTTSIPSGWPGPLAASAVALYSLVTVSSVITSGVNYLVGVGPKGDTGIQGAQGPAALDPTTSRIRIWMPVGAGSTTIQALGFSSFTDVGTPSNPAVGTGSLAASIPYRRYTSAGSAGSSTQTRSPENLFWRGNATGLGGFSVGIRFCMESATSPANQRSFFGLLPTAAIGNVEPDTLVNVVGIAAKAGDANFSIMQNDGTGTATMATLGANFPARATDNVYELLLACDANASSISYTLTNMNTGNVASSSLSSNLPVNTTFLAPMGWTNNGSTASAASFGIMQVIGITRY